MKALEDGIPVHAVAIRDDEASVVCAGLQATPKRAPGPGGRHDKERGSFTEDAPQMPGPFPLERLGAIETAPGLARHMSDTQGAGLSME